MVLVAAWALIALGVLHAFVGLFQFRVPLLAAVAEGFVGRFMQSDTRRLAFWFTLVGPLLILLDQVTLRAVRLGDMELVLLIGGYLLGTAVLGVLAFPRSPLWAQFPPSVILIASGLGVVR